MVETESPSELIRLAGEAWARANGQAKLLDAERKRIRSVLVIHSSEKTLGKAEYDAITQEKYVVAETAAINAETEAEVLKAQYEALKIKYEIWRTKESTKRAEMTMR